MRQLLKERRTPAEPATLKLVLNDPSLYLKADSLAHLTRFTENKSSIQTIMADLKQHRGEANFDRIIRSTLALTEAWLVKNAEVKPSEQEEAAWRQAYFEVSLTAERQALIEKLKAASLPRTQEFALARLQEAHWITRDRGVLVDLLTQTPTEVSWDFILAALENASYYWFKWVANNLIKQRFDRKELVPILKEKAQKYRYTDGKIAAIRLLAQQLSSQATVCPFLWQLSQATTATPPDLLQEVREEARDAWNSMECPKN